MDICLGLTGTYMDQLSFYTELLLLPIQQAEIIPTSKAWGQVCPKAISTVSPLYQLGLTGLTYPKLSFYTELLLLPIQEAEISPTSKAWIQVSPKERQKYPHMLVPHVSPIYCFQVKLFTLSYCCFPFRWLKFRLTVKLGYRLVPKRDGNIPICQSQMLVTVSLNRLSLFFPPFAPVSPTLCPCQSHPLPVLVPPFATVCPTLCCCQSHPRLL